MKNEFTLANLPSLSTAVNFPAVTSPEDVRQEEVAGSRRPRIPTNNWVTVEAVLHKLDVTGQGTTAARLLRERPATWRRATGEKKG